MISAISARPTIHRGHGQRDHGRDPEPAAQQRGQRRAELGPHDRHQPRALIRRSRSAVSGPHGASWRQVSGHAGETSLRATAFLAFSFAFLAFWRFK